MTCRSYDTSCNRNLLADGLPRAYGRDTFNRLRELLYTTRNCEWSVWKKCQHTQDGKKIPYLRPPPSSTVTRIWFGIMFNEHWRFWVAETSLQITDHAVPAQIQELAAAVRRYNRWNPGAVLLLHSLKNNLTLLFATHVLSSLKHD